MNISMPFNYSAITRPVWHIDMPLLVSVLALLSIGLVMVASASFSYAEHNYGNEFFFVKRHLVYLLIAGCAMGFAFLVSPTVWSDYSRLWMLLAIFLLVLVLVV